MISHAENVAFKFIEAMFIKRKVTILETKEKVSGKRVLMLCTLQENDGGADLIPVATILGPEDNARLEELYEMPEGAETRPSNTEDFKTMLGR